jgi:uncharacterized protein (UPF0548 family)
VTSYNYRQIGGTRGELPEGCRIVRREAEVGHGRTRFEALANRLLSWQMHRDARLVVEAQTEQARPDSEVRLGLRLGPLTVGAACRVVYVIEETDRRGFAYGTLAGHPERGESLFEVRLTADDGVRFLVTSFSTPATWWSRAAGPVTRRMQDRVTERYVRAAAAG